MLVPIRFCAIRSVIQPETAKDPETPLSVRTPRTSTGSSRARASPTSTFVKAATSTMSSTLTLFSLESMPIHRSIPPPFAALPDHLVSTPLSNPSPGVSVPLLMLSNVRARAQKPLTDGKNRMNGPNDAALGCQEARRYDRSDGGVLHPCILIMGQPAGLLHVESRRQG